MILINILWEKALYDVIASKLYSSCDSIVCILRENQLLSKKILYFCKNLGRHDGDAHYHVIANFYLANSLSNSSLIVDGDFLDFHVVPPVKSG